MIELPNLSVERLPDHKVLIDADCVAYYGAAGCDTMPLGSATRRVDLRMNQILDDCQAQSYEAYMTGNENFRDDVATLRRYKENRYDKDGKRIKSQPSWLQECRQYLVSEWGAVIINKMEADDMLSIRAYEDQKKYTKLFISTLDKDLAINTCWYHEQTSGNITNITQPGSIYLDAKCKLRGTGIKFFYAQMLMGDRADCIVGLPKVTQWVKDTFNIPRIGGCGHKAAWCVLNDVDSPAEMERRVYECYKSFWTLYGYRHWRTDKMYNPGIATVNKQFLEQGRLLWLRQSLAEMWTPRYIKI